MAFKLVATFLLVCIFGANARRLSFRNCDSSAPIQIGEVNVKSQYPITIKPGYTISASGRYSNRYAATSETVFRIHDIKVERKIFWGYVSVTGLIRNYIPKTVKCTDIEALSPIALCPGAQGNQKFDETFIIPSNLKLPSLAGLLGSGKYRVMADIRDNATGRRVVCVKDAIVDVKL